MAVNNLVWSDSPWQLMGAYIAEPLLVAAALLFLIVHGRWRILNHKAIGLIASVSYSLYLVHGIALDESSRIARHRLAMAATASVILPLLMLYGIERPVARWRRRREAVPGI